MKVKGISLNVSNSMKINFDSLKELVLEYSGKSTTKIIVLQQPSIIREKKSWEISTQTLQKALRVVFEKRVLTKDYNTLPNGYGKGRIAYDGYTLSTAFFMQVSGPFLLR